MIIQALRAVQDEHGYIPDKELHALAEKLKVPVYHLHGVASFYPHFRLQPPPKVTRACTPHTRGSPVVAVVKPSGPRLSAPVRYSLSRRLRTKAAT